MAFEVCSEQRRTAIFRNRHEEPQAPGDDLREEAERLQLRHGAIGEARQLDAVSAHDEGAADLHAAGEVEHGAALDDRVPRFVRRKSLPRTCSGAGRAVGAKRLIEGCQRLGGDQAADDPLAIVRLEAVDPHVRGRQPVPDRQ
jgi:hypothetical protein